MIMRTDKKRFAETGKMVKEILESNVAARNSYMELLIAVARKFRLENFYFDTALRVWEEQNIPSFASIMRARRKVVEENPNLGPNEYIKERCSELEQEYREYYKK